MTTNYEAQFMSLELIHSFLHIFGSHPFGAQPLTGVEVMSSVDAVKLH
jgi:hypothetical protein